MFLAKRPGQKWQIRQLAKAERPGSRCPAQSFRKYGNPMEFCQTVLALSAAGWVRPLKSRKRRILSQKLWNLLGRDWFLATLVFPRVASPTTASAPLPRLQLQKRDLRQTRLSRMCEARIDKRSNAPPTSVRQFFCSVGKAPLQPARQNSANP